MATYLMDRQEIAVTMNYRLAPVVRINMEDGDMWYEGDLVRVVSINRKGQERFKTGTLTFFPDTQKLCVMSCTVGLSSSFGYSDVMELAEKAHAPEVHSGQIVCVVEYAPKIGIASAKLMVADKVSLYYSDCCTFRDLTEEEESGFRAEISKILSE